MKIKPLLYTSLVLMMPLLAGADTVQIVQGTPGDNTFLPATPASPSFPNRIDFSGLSSQITNPNCYSDFGTDCPTFNSSTYASQGATIFSPDGLLIYPASTQTAGGIELFDEGTNGDGDGTANITISLTGGVDVPIDGVHNTIAKGYSGTSNNLSAVNWSSHSPVKS